MLKNTINYDDFQYVVERKKPEKICFGSTGERVTFIGSGRTTQVCPLTYNCERWDSSTFKILNKVRSKRGVGGLANTAPRFEEAILMQMPTATKYDLRKQFDMRPNKTPFNVKSAQRPRTVNKNPGPGTYIHQLKKCRKVLLANNFGHPAMIPAVKVICRSRLQDICDRCFELCSGDYWHRNFINFLCHICWADERYAHEIYPQKELKQFKKIRTCEFKHNHDGTDAAIRLLSDKDILKMEQLENYLDLFITC